VVVHAVSWAILLIRPPPTSTATSTPFGSLVFYLYICIMKESDLLELGFEMQYSLDEDYYFYYCCELDLISCASDQVDNGDWWVEFKDDFIIRKRDTLSVLVNILTDAKV